ncbi:MAG: DNA-directed RNA polymerase subunit N [Bradyrhizobium sp.]|nr:DNA-directed RNA polymerase subunit N [Bradyrhizobium sp.]MDO9294829.1 DNA-directed RNA polymerase subunit N [Bradyrhizobium sp.]
MKKWLVGALVAASFFPLAARAQERAGSAALGAVSGAVVLGPVGAVAGAFIGYTAGPSIARSWGMQRSSSRFRARQTAQSGRAPQQQAAASASAPPPVRTSPLPAKRAAPPPVQGFE